MKESKKALRLLLLIAGLMVCLCSPGALAQDKTDLSLRLLPEYYYKEVVPGEANSLFMEIRNNGSTAVTSIKFDADKPEGWAVEFKPAVLESLGAGSSQTIDVIVTPASRAGRGEYTLTFIAEASETRAATSTMLRIESATSIWLWVGVAIAVLVIAGFIIIFLRLGRQ
jgi:uncharacterized membrane protein